VFSSTHVSEIPFYLYRLEAHELNTAAETADGDISLQVLPRPGNGVPLLYAFRSIAAKH
jgi:hypothetical protein